MISTLFAKVFSPIARWFGFELSINVSDYYLDPTPNGDYINLSDRYIQLKTEGVIPVIVKEIVTPLDPVYFIVNPGPGEKAGEFKTTAEGAVLLPDARWLHCFENGQAFIDLSPTKNPVINLNDHYLDLSQNGGNNDHNHGGGSDVGTKHYH